MARSRSFDRVLSAFRLAHLAETNGLSTDDVLARRDAARDASADVSRRRFLATTALTAGAALTGGVTFAAAPRIAIVGGGLAGLACADRLRAKGLPSVVFEASTRFGGRCVSNRTLVSGMACEGGGELIDTAHKTMLAYANEFGLPVESYVRKRAAERYYFFGRSWSEAEVVDQFRQVVAGMQADLRAISGSATAYASNAADVAFDQLDLATYFATRTAGLPLIEAVLNEAYLAEYGRETSEQSTLNFLGFMRLNKQSKFEPFGVSDERYHLRQGNDGIVAGLAQKLAGSIQTGARLTRLARTATGRYQLFFNGSTRPELADAVVIAIPFTVLRQVDLDPSLNLSADKRRVIDTLGYGTNAKTMVAFVGRPWEELAAASGGVYSDLPNLQNSWESNRANAAGFGIITDYASGLRGQSLRTGALQSQVDSFLSDFDVAIPGVRARAVKNGSAYVAHLEHWPSNPFSLGSYTCYRPGQFTSVAGLEGQAAGALKFAGEHTDSFYSWQGYMEGACLSGIRAADEIRADIRNRRL